MDATTILSRLSNYTLSRTPVNYCLAHLQLKDQLLSYQVLSVLHTFSSIGPGSSFTISVEAGTGMSNTVSSTTNTSAFGIPMMISCMLFIKLFQYAAPNSASRELTSSSPGTAVSARS